MTLQRLYNIAQTGQTAEPTAVDNIMAQYQPKQEGGFWNGLKNFAGSNLGRMTLGGLTGAAIGGLTGRNVNEALLGGIAGATGAAKGITSRNQYFNNLAEKRQERADRMAEAEKTRQLQIDLANKRIEANKAAADLAFERKLQEIAANRDFQRELEKDKRQYALEDRQSNYDFQTKLLERQLENNLALRNAQNDFTREGWKHQANQNAIARQENADLQREQWRHQDEQDAIRRQATLDWQRENMANANEQNKIAREFQANQADVAYGRKLADWQRGQDAKIEAEQRANELYDQRLQNQREYESDKLAEQRKYDAGLLAEQRAYNSGLLANERAYNQEVARQKQLDAIELANIKAQNDAAKQQAKLDYEAQKERQKAELKREEAQRRNTELQPRVTQAIDRAYSALEDGTGLGQFGGWGWTTGQGGQNRADIQNAQAQINTAMRGLLSEMGVGATEMNSAVEANAYRYAITPDMPVAQIKQVLDNFRADYLSGDLQRNLASSVGGSGLESVSTDDLVGML